MPNDQPYPHPLLARDSPLGRRARALVERLNDAEREKRHSHQDQALDDPVRLRRVDLTRDELWGQPTAIRTTLQQERHSVAQAASRASSLDIERIYLLGCGDSLGAGVAVRALYERLLSVPCEPMQALDFGYYYNGLVNERTLVIALSSSGVTARVVEAVLFARALGARTLGLSNTIDSPLMQESEDAILIHATRKGWPTQSTTAAMAVLYKFAFALARLRAGDSDDVSQFEQELECVPDQIELVLAEHNQKVREVAEAEARKDVFLYTAGGPAYACAMFGAAKLKECSLKHAVAIPLEEYHHYVSQRDGDALFLVAPAGATLQRALDTARCGKMWGGKVYGIITRDDRTLEESVDVAFELPVVNELLTPLIYSIPLQLFAYHVGQIQSTWFVPRE